MNGLEGVTVRGIVDLLAAVALLIGLFFMFVGAVGVVRLPDAYNRIHAASKCVTLGLTGMLLATCFHIGTLVVISKALITIAFTFVATPIGSHLLAKAAHHGGLPQWKDTLSDELAQDKANASMAASDNPENPSQSSSSSTFAGESEADDPFEREPAMS